MHEEPAHHSSYAESGNGAEGARTSPRISRRTALVLGGATALAGGGAIGLPRWMDGDSSPRFMRSTDPAVAAAEEARRRTGRVVQRTLTPAPSRVDLGGRVVNTWSYDGSLPGKPIEVTAGDELSVRLVDGLPEPTSVHWHGVALRNDMDGVPDLTQRATAPGAEFDYNFVVPDAGTYWFHPHVGVQLDTGLYAPLIVADPAEPGKYDEEVVLVLDDWTDGWGTPPADLLAAFRRDGMGMGDMDGMDGMEMGMPSAADPLGADTGDVSYPAHLINGRVPPEPVTVTSSPNRRVRFRIVNAASDTAYRFAIGGHRLTVTHTDGFPVVPTVVDALIVGMGERYDVVVTTGDGVFPIVASPEGKEDPAARALLRTASGGVPPLGRRPAELSRRLLSYADLVAAPDVVLGAGQVDRELTMKLTMGDGGRRWLFNGRTFEEHEPLAVAAGERVRVHLVNDSIMFHPIHLHGHTFAVARRDGRGVRKDNLNVLPMKHVEIDLVADYPGRWASIATTSTTWSWA